MNEQTYRLTRGKLHRVNAAVPGGYETIRSGDVLVPSDEELRLYRECLEGPLSETAVLAQVTADPQDGVERNEAPLAPPTMIEKAVSDLLSGVPTIRDVVRSAGQAYLETLRQVESERRPSPRVQVLQMIDRRLRSLVIA